ncbi:MAG: hypothetical protein LBP40_03275 [Campylobacteraceae bacterium]|jgi:alpha-tubulin suppressor-like RCC1 family protein|nr:hypothetical protein [Campylobacteraceae bacterium]
MLLFSNVSKRQMSAADTLVWCKLKTFSTKVQKFSAKMLLNQAATLCLSAFFAIALVGCECSSCYYDGDENGSGHSENITRAPIISAGDDNSFVFLDDGRLYAAGYNSHSQLGLGDKSSHAIFTQVSLDSKNIIAIESNFYHSLILSYSGMVYAAGINNYGQLGISDNSSSAFKEATDLGDKNITAIAIGIDYSLALSYEGRVYVAGNSSYGQLGLGGSSRGFREASDLSDKNITYIAAGSIHSFAISDEGKVYTAGYNEYGQLGLGDNNNRDIFTEITDLRDKNITAIAVGGLHTIALSLDGKVYVTGNNGYGQLGFENKNNHFLFTEITDLRDKNITAVSAGSYHSFAFSNESKIYASGANQYGQLGLGDNNHRRAFTQVLLP